MAVEHSHEPPPPYRKYRLQEEASMMLWRISPSDMGLMELHPSRVPKVSGRDELCSQVVSIMIYVWTMKCIIGGMSTEHLILMHYVYVIVESVCVG